MALGFFTQLAGDRATAWSGGSEPAAGLEVADVRPIRDELERRVRALLDQLEVPAT